MIVAVSAHVNPTEDVDRVRSAMENIFPNLDLLLQEPQGMAARLVGSGDERSLDRLHELLRSRMILDTARNRLEVKENVVTFVLNKQAAAAGKVSFPPDEEPLGSIWVEIIAKDPAEAQKVVDWLAPPTTEGSPQFEIEL